MRPFLLCAALVLAAPLAAQDWTAEPLYGTATLESGFTPDPHPIEVVSGGMTSNPVDGPGCVGYIADSQPDVNVDYSASSLWDLAIYAEADHDTALLIHAPNGDWYCDDDSDGLNPRVDFPSPMSGTYAVWVASFDEEGGEATLYVTEQLAGDDGYEEDYDDGYEMTGEEPDWQAEPLYGDVVLQFGFSPDPNQTSVLAGGADPNPIQGPGCVGYIAAGQPDVNVTYAAGSTWDLGFYVESDSDTALLIRGPNGDWYCDDDTDGLNPRVTVGLPPSGTYNVWIATFGEDNADAVLNVTEEFRSQQGPDYRAAPLRGRVTLASGFRPDPYTVDVTAGGPDENPIDGVGCVGYIDSAQPDVVVDYTASGVLDLYVNVESASDTALLIHMPSGDWLCDDDGGEALNPRVHIQNPESGAYAIWVGTFGEDVDDAELHISELDE